MMIRTDNPGLEIPTGLNGLGVDPGEVDPTTGVLNAGCIGCATGPTSSGGGDGTGAGTGWDAANAALANCDEDLVAQGYTCTVSPDGTYHYAQPQRSATGTTGTTGTPGTPGTGTSGSGGTGTGAGAGTGTGQNPATHGGTKAPTSTLAWVLVGGIALLLSANVLRARK